MRIVAAALAAFLFCLAPGLAQQMAGEQLFVPPPKGWKVGFHERKGNLEVTELLPADQTVQDWSEMLTVQVVSGKPTKQPQEVLRDQMVEIEKSCEDIGAGQVNLSVENGYDTALRAIACTRSKQWGKGELSLYKVLSGRERLYVVARSWRGEPFAKDHLPVGSETTREWLAFMQQVLLCDSRDASHPCPDSHAAGTSPNPHR
jgi:hypothetical protein